MDALRDGERNRFNKCSARGAVGTASVADDDGSGIARREGGKEAGRARENARETECVAASRVPPARARRRDNKPTPAPRGTSVVVAAGREGTRSGMRRADEGGDTVGDNLD